MAIKILAGDSALNEIRDNGLSPERVKLMIGASGGPKWLMLSRLDQYLAEHFMPKASQGINLLGSSIGAWRMACYAQRDPLAAFKEFEYLYMNQRYGEVIRPEAITEYIHFVLGRLLGDERSVEIVNNPKRKLHIVAVRNRRLLNGHSRLAQGTSLSLAALGNVITPKVVNMLYPRVVISPDGRHEPYIQEQETIQLTSENLKESLIASGAIPLVMEPSRIKGGKERWYWDGGVADYHFSGPFKVDDGLVLYPHFSPKIIPGWFDKGLPWRSVLAENYSNVVMLTPSKDFIEKLPYSKIPDRKDFEQLSDTDREGYWQQVLDATMHLVEDLDEALSKDGGRSIVEPLSSIL